MPQAPYMPRPAKKGPNGFAIAGLVVSLIAIFVVLERFSQYVSPFGVVGLILSILGYMVNMDDEGEGRSRTARIFAIVGGVLSLITIVITLLVGLFNPNLSSGLWF
jgi:xanthine/uracil permease